MELIESLVIVIKKTVGMDILLDVRNKAIANRKLESSEEIYLTKIFGGKLYVRFEHEGD